MLDLKLTLRNKNYVFLFCIIFIMGLFSCQEEAITPDEVSIQEQANLSSLGPTAKDPTVCEIEGAEVVQAGSTHAYVYTHNNFIQNPVVTWTSSPNITLNTSTSPITAQFASDFNGGWIRANGVSSTSGFSCTNQIQITTGVPPCVPELTGPDPICVGQFSTFDWSCPGDVTWSVSGNLIIVNETDTQIIVSGTNEGTGTITGTLNGVTLSKTVDINAPPTPSGSVSIAGPDLLKYYQSGLFTTNLSLFDGYTEVEWVIYSFDFQNAPIHFNVTHPLNADHYAQVEVLPTAPEGIYYVQCRVINDCGMYVMDKSFEVQAGPPTIFDVEE